MFVVLLALVGAAFAHPLDLATCPFPNGSETAMHSFECESGMQININNIKVTDTNMKPLYPMDPKKPMVLNLVSYNNGAPVTNNTVDVKLFEYKTSWTSNQCKWQEVPTLGLLNGINGCSYANNCPLKSGPLNLLITLDLSEYANIINMLAGNKPYQLQITMHDLTQGADVKKDIACVVAQVHLI